MDPQSHSGSPAGPRSPGGGAEARTARRVPRWVKVSIAVALAVVAALVLAMVLTGGGHGPSRHLPTSTLRPDVHVVVDTHGLCGVASPAGLCG